MAESKTGDVRKMQRAASAFLLFFSFFTPALAQQPADRPAETVGWYSGEFQACGEKTSTIEITSCTADLAAKWDRRLNAAYQALLAREPPEQRERLRAAERAWLQFRDANCDYYINSGGTIANIKYAECRRVLTAERAIELETAGRP